ncbi:hypothetical protein HHI36_016351, partial [Cryptolaemus montrouzieri]
MAGGDDEPEDRSSKTAKVSDLKVFTCDHCNKKSWIRCAVLSEIRNSTRLAGIKRMRRSHR